MLMTNIFKKTYNMFSYHFAFFYNRIWNFVSQKSKLA
eukprot:UN24142